MIYALGEHKKLYLFNKHENCQLVIENMLFQGH